MIIKFLQRLNIYHISFENIIFKKGFRWTFEFNTKVGMVGNWYVKSIQMPKRIYNKEYLRWEWTPLNVVYHDVIAKDMTLMNYVMSPSPERCVTAKLKFFDVTGGTIQTWTMELCPRLISFTNPDYANSNECNIELEFELRSVAVE